MNTSERFGELRRFTGEDVWVTITGIGQSHNQLQVREGDLFWLDSDGGVLIDTVTSSFVDPILLQRSVSFAWTTRDQYRQAVREKRLRDCPPDAEIIQAETHAPPHLAPLVKLGVRFQSL